MILSCHHCNTDSALETALLTVAGPHVKASCPICGKYIKFISRKDVPAHLLVEAAFKPQHRSVIQLSSINPEDIPF